MKTNKLAARHESYKKTNALALLDGIIGAHGTDGSAGGMLIPFVPRVPIHSLLESYGVDLGGIKTKEGWEFEGESVKMALYLARASLEVLFDFDDKLSKFPLKDQLSLFNTARYWPNDRFIAYAKYMTAWPMARWMRSGNQLNDLPEVPEGFKGNPLVYSGKIRKYLKSRMISHQWKTVALPWSILQGVKRACLQAPEDYIHATMLKHKKILTKKPTNMWGVRVSYDSYIKDAFQGFKFKNLRLHEASTSASYEYKRSQGGNRQFVREKLGARRLGLKKLKSNLYDYDIVGEEGDLSYMIETAPGKVEEVQGLKLPDSYSMLQRAGEEVKKADGILNITVAAVLEPLKVRLISKGQSLPYYVSVDYQKSLWRHLQKFPQFSLTGRPMNSSDLHEILRFEFQNNFPEEDMMWVSGDYSAATDNLESLFTQDVFEESLMKSGLSWEDMDIMRSVIYNQKIHYPGDMVKKGGLEPAYQTNGQLMGSTLSFPILCIVNLITYAKSIHQWLGRKVPLKDLPVKINGDDILFRATPELYEIWKSNVKQVGFDLSVGKNYIHPTLLTVNSELYHMEVKTKENIIFKKIYYLNVGLLTGQSKLSDARGRKSDSDGKILADAYNLVIKGSINKRRIQQRFIHYNREAIENATNLGKYNIYLPPQRGGLGFELYQSQKVKLTSFQRRFATLLEKEYKEELKKGIIPSSELGVVPERTNPMGIQMKHKPNLKLAVFGPVEQDSKPYTPKSFKFPPLLKTGDPEENKMTYKDFTNRYELIKSNIFNRMGDKEIFDWPYRVVEVPYGPYSDETKFQLNEPPMKSYFDGEVPYGPYSDETKFQLNESPMENYFD